METENNEKVGTGNGEKMEKEVKEEDIVHTVLTCSRAGKPEAKPEVETLKLAVKKYLFILDTSFNDFEEENELVTSVFAIE